VLPELEPIVADIRELAVRASRGLTPAQGSSCELIFG
jgi:hypothetical protein